MDWMQMMGEEDPMQQQMSAPYSSMMQPQTFDLEAAHKPVASPQEYEQRLTGWQQLANRFMSDPNLQRAMMLTGAMMMQPIAPGQTTGGALANAGVVGLNAYNVGQAQNLAQQAALRKEGRENRELGIREQESAARIAESGERVETSRAARPGIAAEAEVKSRTVEDLIQSAGLNRRKLETATQEAERDAALRELTRDNEALKAQAERGNIPRRVQQEIELNEEKLANLRATRTAAGATARRGHAEAEQTELENEALRSMTPEQRAAHTRSTRGGATSATVQQYEMWAGAYDRIKQQNPSSPEIQGKTRDEYAVLKMSAAKAQGAATELARLLAAGLDEDDPLIQQLRQQAQLERGQRGQAAPAQAPAPAGKSGEPPKVTNEAEYNALPPGTVYIGPDGKRRKKRG